MTYEAEAEDAIRRVPLDSLTALYHRPSGQTHLVAAPVPELLDALAVEPRDAAALLAAMGIDDDAEARAVLAARLDELIAIGLVRAR